MALVAIGRPLPREIEEMVMEFLDIARDEGKGELLGKIHDDEI